MRTTPIGEQNSQGKKRGSERKRGEGKGEKREAERSRVEREEGEEESQGGAGEASVYPMNRMKRKRLFYTQVRSWGSAVPVREKVNCTCTTTTRGELGVELKRKQKCTKKKQKNMTFGPKKNNAGESMFSNRAACAEQN